MPGLAPMRVVDRVRDEFLARARDWKGEPEREREREKPETAGIFRRVQ